MAYDATNDLTAMDVTRPVGSTETVSILDDALRETRLVMKNVITNEHTSTGLHKAGSIVNSYLATNAVETTNIKDANVTLGKMASGVLSGANLTTGSVVEVTIGAGAVTSTKLGTGAVTSTALAAGAVLSAAIGAAQVTVTKMGGATTAVIPIGQGDGTFVQHVVSGDATMLATGEVAIRLRAAFLSDQKSFGTSGGDLTAGAWVVRDINSTDSDVAGLSTLAGNQVSLALGFYLCLAFCPAHQVGAHRVRLYNSTTAAEVLLGPTAIADSPAMLLGIFQVTTASDKYQIEHYGSVTQLVDGLGFPFSVAGNIERYTSVIFFKVG